MTKNGAAGRGFPLLWSIAAVVSLALVVWVALRNHGSGVRPTGNGIVVLHSRSAAVSRPLVTVPLATVTAGASPRLAANHVEETYSVLSGVSLGCDAGRCTFRATIRPPAGQADVDQRQQMLVGGLAKTLAEDGYALVEPLRMNEVDDNLFRIEVSVVPPGGQGR